MQREEFCKTLLEDDLIANIFSQIKEIFAQFKSQKVTKWILELDEGFQHKNEMSKFVKYINDKLQIRGDNYNKNNESNYLEELKSDEEKIVENNIINTPVEEINKKIKRKKNKKIEEEKVNNNNTNKIEEKEEMQFKDIDEILNYINDDTDSKKGKKKGKKAKKNKNKNSNNKEEKENRIINNENDNDNEVSELLHNFEKEFENFKNEITKDTIFIYEINNKIKPCLSDNFLNSISIM